MKNTLLIITCLAFLFTMGCKKKSSSNPQPQDPNTNNPVVVPKKKVTYETNITLYNLTQSAIVNKPYTLYNFARKDFMESRADSFDLAFYTRTVKTNGNDTIYHSLCGPSYYALRLELGDEIKYKTRKTVFYLPKNELAFYLSQFDTIQYASSCQKIIEERFDQVYDTKNGEDGYVLQKNVPFIQGSFIGFKTHTGRYGIMRITSDGLTAQSIYVKFSVKYDR